MNRVCLSGWFASRPKITYGPCGLAFAEMRLRVPHPGTGGQPPDPDGPHGCDLVPCLATGALAVALYTWGEAHVPVELEGRLVSAFIEGAATAQPAPGPLAVHADSARLLEDPLRGLAVGMPRDAVSLVLVVPAHPGQGEPGFPAREAA